MILEKKPAEHVVPEYSLTGDLLSYRSCHMQYRYYNGSSLPPSRPVQLWYGEFIHGCLEEAYRLWTQDNAPFPWPYTEIEDVGGVQPPPDGLPPNDLRRMAWPIERALLQQNKRARSRRARRSAYRRASVAINVLGPCLFQLISVTEQRLIRTREMPSVAEATRRASRYVLTGIVDVLTNIELATVAPENPIASAVHEACRDPRGTFEVIVDYKSSHRPKHSQADEWLIGEWQVKTYAWLRQGQPEAPRVVAGVLLYLNELSPSAEDVERVRREVNAGETDVVPARGSSDERELQLTRSGSRVNLSEEFRLRRAIRVVPIGTNTLEEATGQFDEIVANIESHINREALSGSIRDTWQPTCEDEKTCVACDFYSFCPDPAGGRRDIVPDDIEPEEP